MTGEQIAEGYLRKSGFSILCRNFRTPFGEIDLVCKDNGTIVFVEVKTRTQDAFGPPHLSITRKKQMTIIRNATYYLKRFHLLDSPARIDVVAVMMTAAGILENVEYIRSAIWDDRGTGFRGQGPDEERRYYD